ncbi:Txe/YoeB family addiction module toxin [Sphingobacterium sp. SGG-5]|uniref:Txe/YoeB family addiction module toxin n=1 Tax=Sphingobacterium sp. SGG-5 TaxID=2710881 RepID=UPI0013ECE757|nr:Txe/YoeB family addiction module toxin [Sphingobacterium sp. SGG-5]NGM60846.1 Txe/YoeB family addiction module toxin [Sphingobacterium sp. SGG-5]
MSYRIVFSLNISKDIAHIEKSGNKKLLKKLYLLLEELKEHPRQGTGKPEQLKYYTEPTWSRRISEEHRLVYEIQDEVVTVLVLSAYGHYNDK